MSDSTSTSTSTSDIASSPVPASTSVTTTELLADEKGGLSADELKQFVMIPHNLVKKFDIGKVWERSLGKKEIFLIKDPSSDQGNLVAVMAVDCSYLGVTHGSVGGERIDILIRRTCFAKSGKRDHAQGLEHTIATNHLYHEQLKALMVKRRVSELPPVNVSQSAVDESGSCNPQLRFDMGMIVPIPIPIGEMCSALNPNGKNLEDFDPVPTAILGKGTLVGLDCQDMCQWVRHKVVGMLPNTLLKVVESLPTNYAEISPAELADRLDQDATSKRKYDADSAVGPSARGGSDEAYEWEVSNFEEREKIRLARIIVIETELAWLKAANPPTATTTTESVKSTESTEPIVSA